MTFWTSPKTIINTTFVPSEEPSNHYVPHVLPPVRLLHVNLYWFRIPLHSQLRKLHMGFDIVFKKRLLAFSILFSEWPAVSTNCTSSLLLQSCQQNTYCTNVSSYIWNTVTMQVGKQFGLLRPCFTLAVTASNSSFLTNLKPSSAKRHSSVASTTKSGSSCLFTSCTCLQTWTWFAVGHCDTQQQDML